MQASINLINERLKNAPQEVLDRLLGYLDAISNDYTYDIPQWQQELVFERKKTKTEDYLSLESLDHEIRLQK
jgi:hypothetical protein